MSYIDNNLLPNERILFRTRKHVVIFFFPVLVTILSYYAYDFMHSNPVLLSLEWVPWLITLILWGYAGLEFAFSEYAVTNMRIMMREGFFYRHANEMRLSAISQVGVSQSLFGQMLNYGLVAINAFGAYDAFSLVAQPFLFQKTVNEQLMQLSSRPGSAV